MTSRVSSACLPELSFCLLLGPRFLEGSDFGSSTPYTPQHLSSVCLRELSLGMSSACLREFSLSSVQSPVTHS